MAFELLSPLFSKRDTSIGSIDIQHGIESFLRREFHVNGIYCKVSGATLRTDIYVNSTAFAEAIMVREENIRRYIHQELACSLGQIRVILNL